MAECSLAFLRRRNCVPVRFVTYAMTAPICPNYTTAAPHPDGKVSTLQFQGANFVPESDSDNDTNDQEKRKDFSSKFRLSLALLPYISCRIEVYTDIITPA